jgi:TonB-dependent SusC/RagA subfamily outer membrane receptor
MRLSYAIAGVSCICLLTPAALGGQQQTARAASRSGATCTTIPGAELVTLSPGSTLSHALRGKVAGLTIATSGGMVGTGSTFFARGVSSFLGPVEPVILLDGTRLTPMNRGASGAQPATQVLDLIDPADVERVEVLRGPAATALYGTNGSGGVIHVFTKQGDHKAAPVADPKSSCP